MQNAECKMKKLEPSDYRVSEWSGGTTTQLAIWPENAVYADRDFLWRVSSATVDLEASDFTPLPDYERLIATLQGEIVLTHNGGEPLRLRPLEVHAFSGADATHSVGRCTDFNLMLRRGRAAGSMEALRLTEAPTRLSVGAAGEGAGIKDQESGIKVGSAFRVQRSEPVGAVIGRPEDAPAVGTSSACPQAAPGETALLYCVEGTCSVGAVNGRPEDAALRLHTGEALLLTDPAELTLTGPATLMLCRITV